MLQVDAYFSSLNKFVQSFFLQSFVFLPKCDSFLSMEENTVHKRFMQSSAE